MLHKNILIKARIQELKEQVVELTRRKERKRKRIQTGSIIEFSAGVLQIAKSASAARTTSKKSSSRGS
jgi:uncharacterized protein Veg